MIKKISILFMNTVLNKNLSKKFLERIIKFILFNYWGRLTKIGSTNDTMQ